MSEEAKETVVENEEVVEIELETPSSTTEEVENAEIVTTKESEATETVTESVSDEEELEQYSSKVQKRINNLTRKLREEERAKESNSTFTTSCSSARYFPIFNNQRHYSN